MRIRDAFIRPLIESINNPTRPRNLILRGRFSKATSLLMSERIAINELAKQRQTAGNLDRELDQWLEEITPLYAEQLRAAKANPALASQLKQQIEAKWNTSSALGLLFAEATARPRSAQLTYQLGLCKQEEAEIRQVRLQMRPGGPASASEARNAWEEALNVWYHFLEDYPRDQTIGAVRQLRARALSQLGKWEEAAEAWENVAPPLSPLEQVASLYQAHQARQIRKANEKK